MTKQLKREDGMLVVEASIVFPTMFLIIIFMMYAGNAYLQKCRIESIVERLTIEGAAYCADPFLYDMQQGKIPAYNTDKIRPYRFMVGGMDEIEADIQTKLNQEIRSLDSGLFSNMKPTSVVISTPEFHNAFIYSTFSVDVSYKVVIPVQLLGTSELISMSCNAHSDMPVTNAPEFIRNVDMVEDYMERTGAMERIQQAVEKAKEWFRN